MNSPIPIPSLKRKVIKEKVRTCQHRISFSEFERGEKK
jgi:hypothetical protein